MTTGAALDDEALARALESLMAEMAPEIMDLLGRQLETKHPLHVATVLSTISAIAMQGIAREFAKASRAPIQKCLDEIMTCSAALSLHTKDRFTITVREVN